MSEFSDFRTPDTDELGRDELDDAELEARQFSKQEIAHDRGRICKKRGCVVCAPLVEQRRLKKKQRKIEAQNRAHEKGQPCGRSSCTVAVCVEARNAAEKPETPAATTTPSSGKRSAAKRKQDPEVARRRQDEKHRVGLPCGSESCGNPKCIDGFANERKRRHRARRPCRSSTCDNAICVAARSSH